MADFGQGKLLPGGLEQINPKNPKASDKFYDWKDQNYPKNADEWVRPRRISEPFHALGGKVAPPKGTQKASILPKHATNPYGYCAGGKVIKSTKF